MKAVYRAYLFFTALCLLFSVYVHGCAWLGLSALLPSWYWILHIGIFVIAVPLILVCDLTGVNTKRGDFFKILQKGAPLVLRRIPSILVVYFIANFAWMIRTVGNDKSQFSSAPAPPEIVRAFSAGWMMFYGTASVAFYSLSRRPELINELRRK